MIDDDDVRDFALLSNPQTKLGAILTLIVLVVLAVIASMNDDECAQRTCPAGQTPKLMKHECLCVTIAKEPGARP